LETFEWTFMIQIPYLGHPIPVAGEFLAGNIHLCNLVPESAKDPRIKGDTMLRKNIRLPKASIAAFALALTAAAFSGCNQDAVPTATDSASKPSTSLPTLTSSPENPIVIEGRALIGADLEAFLKAHPEANRVPEASAPPVQSLPAAKTAANPACLIDFASNKGLTHMADYAYTTYATSPYYIQACFPYYAFVTPSTGSYYFLPTEASGTCAGSYRNIGTGTPGNCQNQQSALNFPRYASNGNATTYNGSLGLVVTLPQDGIDHNFRVNYFLGRGGVITAYAYRVGIGWTAYGPFSGTPSFFTLAGATNVTNLQFYSSNGGVFQVDNISITGL
jgi:hypothetical protein